MGVMNFVFPITALYFGPFALAFYWRWGRTTGRTLPSGNDTAAARSHEMAMTSSGDSVRSHGDPNLGPKTAAKADVISLTAFEIGLFSWMAVFSLVIFAARNQLTPSSAAYWFFIQIGRIIGFFTSWPANVWLARRGIKIAM